MKTMKIFGLMLLLVMSTLLIAQDADAVEVKMDEKMADYEEAMQEAQEALESAQVDLDNANINITLPQIVANKTPKMGVFLEDIDFQEAYEKHYDYNYGVLISGVVRDGNAYRAGIMKGDIIMEFDGTKVRHESHLSRLIRNQQFGNTVTVKYFRDEQVFDTTLTFTLPKEVTMGEKGEIIVTQEAKKKKYSVGHGGGSWIPVWYTPDVENLNMVMANLGFGDEVISEDGILLQGGGGKGHVGHGWFVGGMGVGYENSKTTRVDWDIMQNDSLIVTLNNVPRKLSYGMNYWGVTLDKRYALSKKFVSSIGFALGGGKQWIKVKQTADNGDIPNFNFNDPHFGDNYDYESVLKMKQNFVIFQPKAMVMYHFLDWLGLRLEAGYLGSYAPYGWKVTENGEKVDFANEPEIDMNGLTLTIGPWFGF